jgi:hypothetical protein
MTYEFEIVTIFEQVDFEFIIIEDLKYYLNDFPLEINFKEITIQMSINDEFVPIDGLIYNDDGKVFSHIFNLKKDYREYSFNFEFFYAKSEDYSMIVSKLKDISKNQFNDYILRDCYNDYIIETSVKDWEKWLID